MDGPGRRDFLISNTRLQAVVLVVVSGFSCSGLLAYRTSMAHPPVPARVVDRRGMVLFTAGTLALVSSS